MTRAGRTGRHVQAAPLSNLTAREIKMARVLVIDDNPTFLTATSALLGTQNTHLAVHTITEAEGALRAIQQIDYDVIMTDYHMPGFDGLWFLGECKKLRPDTPVVMLTGYGDHEIEERAKELGAYAFLHKPVQPEVLLSVLSRSLLRAHLRRNVVALPSESGAQPADVADQLVNRIQRLNERLLRALNSTFTDPPRS
jgi:DNA-binding NtrC family response regulator